MRNLVIGLVALAGCGGPVDNTPHIDFASQPYTLQPGEEKYLCYTMRLPSDREIAISKLVPTYGQGTHHILFSQTIAPEQDGAFECNVLIKPTWVPLYAAGRQAGPVTMPAGAGLKMLTKGQQLVMQLHLQNATTQPITDTTSMRIETIDASQPFLAAGIFGLDDRVLDIPAHDAAAMNTMSCTIDKHLDVFAVLGHMHKHGKHLTLTRAGQPLFDTDWNFDVQPVTALTATIEMGDTVALTCTHENDGDAAIPYGESSDQEMCASVFYYTPFDALDGCINQ